MTKARLILEIDVSGPQFEGDDLYNELNSILDRFMESEQLVQWKGAIRDSAGAEVGSFRLEGERFRNAPAPAAAGTHRLNLMIRGVRDARVEWYGSAEEVERAFHAYSQQEQVDLAEAWDLSDKETPTRLWFFIREIMG